MTSASMEPTCTNTIVYSVADAHIILYAVYEGRLPMVHRRPCNDDERARIRSGAVFVWEEGSGIERWTDRKEWGDSRSREDFLFYTEGTKSSFKPPGTDPHSVSGLGNSTWSGPSSSIADPLVKQTYTALVKRNGTDRKWHLIAYFTEGTKHHLRTVSEDPALARLRVPPGLFSQARLPKSRRVRDRTWTGSATAGGPVSGPTRERESAGRRRGTRGSSSSVATSPLTMTGTGSSSIPHEVVSPVVPTSASAYTPMEDVTPTGYHSPAAYTSSYVPADAESISYPYAPSYSSQHNFASTSSAPAASGYNSPYASPPPPHCSSSPAFTAHSSTEALPTLAPLTSALGAGSSSTPVNALASPAPRVDEPPPPVSQIRAKEVVKLTPLDRTTHGGFAPRHPIDMRALHRLQVAC